MVDDWDLYGSYEARVYFETPDLSEELIREIQRRAYRSFYLRPSYVIRKLLSFHTYRFLLRSVKGLWGFVLRSGG